MLLMNPSVIGYLIMNLKILLTLLLFTTTLFAAPNNSQIKYSIDPNNTKLESVNYNPELHMLVIKIHVEVLWLKFSETYGLKVLDNSNIDSDWKRIVGGQPEVIHLKEI